MGHATVLRMLTTIVNVPTSSTTTQISLKFTTENGNSNLTTGATTVLSPDTMLTKSNLDQNFSTNVRVRSSVVVSCVSELVTETAPSSVVRDLTAKTGSTENHSISTNAAWPVPRDTEQSSVKSNNYFLISLLIRT